jgi:dihydroorotate dehydrogenase electron transfer subunit
MPQKLTLQIESNEEVTRNIRRLVLAGQTDARPGQFVQVHVSASYDPFLPRPISVHRCAPEHLSLLYRVAGRGTSLLAEKKSGETLRLFGPLGNGFTVSQQPVAVVLGGGIGAAPLFALLQLLREAGKQVFFFFGAKTKAELFLIEEYRHAADEFGIATDDGTAGFHGFVTQLAEPVLTAHDAAVYACGPEPMLREAARLARKYQRECHVSLEARMACGVGACLGCVVPTGRDGAYKRVCADGPVFTAEEAFPYET